MDAYVTSRCLKAGLGCIPLIPKYPQCIKHKCCVSRDRTIRAQSQASHMSMQTMITPDLNHTWHFVSYMITQYKSIVSQVTLTQRRKGYLGWFCGEDNNILEYNKKKVIRESDLKWEMSLVAMMLISLCLSSMSKTHIKGPRNTYILTLYQEKSFKLQILLHAPPYSWPTYCF